MIRILKTTVVGVLFSVATLASAQTAPSAEGQGEIHKLDFGGNKMVINGYNYDVDPNVEVEINGSYGAFTMLEEGMLIEYVFLRFDDGSRRVTEIFEVDEIEEY